MTMEENIKQPSEEELKATAGSYHALGLSVIPFKLTKKGEEYEKLNLSSWKKWETELQTDEEFIALNWNGANAFAVVLGTQARNGLYLSVVDYDCKGNDVTDEVKEKGRALLKEFPITCMEQTVNKGLHLIYWTRTKPKTIGTYHNTASLELLGEKKLCLMSPSLGYSKLNDNSPTELENIEQNFYDTMKKHGLLREQNQTTRQPARRKTANTPRPCIIEALNCQLTGPNGHLMRLAIAGEYKRLGYTEEEIIDLFRNQADFDYNTCRTQISSVDQEKTANCTTITELGYCLPSCSFKEDSVTSSRKNTSKTCDDSKLISSPGIVNPQVIFEQLKCDAHGNYYVVWNRLEQKIQARIDVWRNYTIDEVQYFPLPRLPWPAIESCTEYESEETLYGEIRSFIIEHLDVPNDSFYDVYSCFVLATWRAEEFKVVPYIFFLGPLSSGKTRGLECLHRLCYRAILAASMSASAIFRSLEAWHPTLLLDETEIYNKESMTEVLALLNSGYRKGQYAIRIEKAEEGNPQIGMFDTFGFKAMAGTDELAATLQSRCIITAMSRAVRRVTLFMDEEKAQILRNKLLMYRFKNLGKASNDMITAFVNDNAGFRNARVIELFISLIQVAPTEEVKNKLTEHMKQITQSRLDAEQASIEARIFDAILKSANKVDGGKISTQAITEVFNDGLTERDQATSRFIGRKVAALGFEKCRVGGKGQAGFFWDATLVERLKARYFPNGSQLTSETPETSETTVTMGKQSLTGYLHTEVTEVNSPVKDSQKSDNSPLKTVVSEVTEQTEVKSEPFLCCDCEPQKASQPDDKEETANTYSQLACYFCQKAIMDNDWEQSSFSENKPAHKKCCNEKRSQLKQATEMPDFEDKCQPPEEAS